MNGHLSEQETRCQGQKDDTKKIIGKERKIEMFPLASMPLSSDSSGNQKHEIYPRYRHTEKRWKHKTPMYGPMQVEGI